MALPFAQVSVARGKIFFRNGIHRFFKQSADRFIGKNHAIEPLSPPFIGNRRKQSFFIGHYVNKSAFVIKFFSSDPHKIEIADHVDFQFVAEPDVTSFVARHGKAFQFRRLF